MMLVTSKAIRTLVVIVCIFVFVTLWKLPLHRPHSFPRPSFHDHTLPSEVDWSRFAYTQYVTNTAYLCNSVMLFETLHRLGSKADRFMMYPAEFSTQGDSVEAKLLRKARDEYGVTLAPIKVQSRNTADTTWAQSYTKLLAFNQTQYDRVLSLDSDATVLQAMDELFLLPPSPVAIPRAYWLNFDDRVMSSQLMLVQPSAVEFSRIEQSIAAAGSKEYDMEIVNDLYRDSACILPHRPYNLVTGEFRSKNHTAYLGNSQELWDPAEVLRETKFLHFSDWPVPKPWIQAPETVIAEKKPECEMDSQTGRYDDCRARDIWLGLYDDFAQRRQRVCGMSLSTKG
ncbi:nucleotide-diphospho-sugar transferase [Aspergillus sclerotioniger CBS 115572]|uniref:Nucleotide-diphospho-sugar transferase n=1 Tax=Aspergillus sclerotioniger CBS 115572 TaxID=1450535 RepID=A0A317VJK9_9EURO|nr:nucleotide-diphospho-sugar transferase [Aspergillus sclerotioniger CBS 115572]PWY74496.1 nucleotide-diphospho-sugar transferase [Aspergillus sclerotioniger CBS 115572]